MNSRLFSGEKQVDGLKDNFFIQTNSTEDVTPPPLTHFISTENFLFNFATESGQYIITET